MIEQEGIKKTITHLLAEYSKLPDPQSEAEKKTEEFIRTLFESLGWQWLSSEVTPQKKVMGRGRATRVDYAFRKRGDIQPSFYLEVKRFSSDIHDENNIRQALEYGKNGGIRWVVLTNFKNWRVFNSDFFNELQHAELFEFSLADCLQSQRCLEWLLLLSHVAGSTILDEYAKQHKKWKPGESVEDLLTDQLARTREKLSKAIYDQNTDLFDTEQKNEDITLDSCVQHILDRIIFCRMLEDNGLDPDHRLRDVFERWKSDDKRIQFYRENLCSFWAKMRKKYDSTIFDNHRIDGLSIKNDDFIPLLEEFYVNKKTNLTYRFEAIGTDILGHAYENYLSYTIKKTPKRIGLKKDLYKRKQSGIYYTPEFLADYLVRSTLGIKLQNCSSPQDALKIRVLDPACGSGTFLVRAFEEFRQWIWEYSRSRSDVDEEKISDFLMSVLENCLYGIDLDPRAAQLARLNLFLRGVHTHRPLPRLKIINKNSLVWDQDDTKSFIIQRDFPLVAEAGGFDVVLGNPPWEKWKPDSQEFFEQFEPGFKSLPTQEAKHRMAELLKTRRLIKIQWEGKLREYQAYADIFRRTYRHQSASGSASGDPDLYKIFTERFYQLLKEGGLAGIVVPSGIYTDLGAKGLRILLFDMCRIKGLFSFENRKFIFPDIDQRYKFVLLTFQKGGKTTSFPCAFFLHTEQNLNAAIASPTTLEVDFIKKSSPTSWNVLEIKSLKDHEIVKKLLKYPPLGQTIEGAWNIETQSGFHMTNDSHLFRKNVLLGVPMLEGKNIEQFTHRWKEAPTPRFKIFEKDILAHLKPDKIYHNSYWMAYRLIASSTNYRTFISTIVPPGYVCGNSIAIVQLPDLKQLCFLVGVMNSFVIDYFLRQKVSANINMFYFLETPVPRLTSGKECDEIARKVAQLVCTTDEFDELKKAIGIEFGLTNENDRDLARVQLDVMVAKLYGVTKEELAYILEKFPLIEQRQKELILSSY